MAQDSIEAKILALLLEYKIILAVGEASTGGLITKRLTDLPGASAAVLGGVVAYHNAAKETILQVPGHVLNNYGAVSEETADAMSEGVLSQFHYAHRQGPLWEHF